jgi:hypothetical protein
LSARANDPTALIMDARAPFPPDWTARRGRDAYLAENGFTVDEYEARWTKASFFMLDFAVPNTKKHRAAIMLHDLHHVATGFGTDLAGEGEISAWEVRAGLRGLGLYVGAIVVSGALMGLMLAPRRTIRAWKAANGARALWTRGLPYDALLAKKIDELRALAGVPREGIATGVRALHKNAPRASLQSSAPA